MAKVLPFMIPVLTNSIPKIMKDFKTSLKGTKMLHAAVVERYTIIIDYFVVCCNTYL